MAAHPEGWRPIAFDRVELFKMATGCYAPCAGKANAASPS
jgi:hypothetical protein